MGDKKHMILDELFGESLEKTLETKLPLRFDENGRFRMLMVSDIHGGVGYNRKKTVAAMDALVESSRPQLVLLGGDNAGPGYIHIETTDDLRSLLTDISAPMESRGIPWAHVFGNHDDNYGVKNEDAERIYEEFPHCVSKAGPAGLSGVGNYLLPVYPSVGREPVFGVWGMDSHGGMTEFAERHGKSEPVKMLHPFAGGHGSYDSVDIEQVMWYYLVSKEIEKRYGRKLPALMYAHIPLPEYEIIVHNKDDTHFFGYHDEDVACTALNPGLFRAIVERGDVRAFFCGHDHWNDWQAEYLGIKLGYDASMSYHACQNNLLRGGRIFEVNESDPWNIATETIKIRDIMGHAGDSDE